MSIASNPLVPVCRYIRDPGAPRRCSQPTSPCCGAPRLGHFAADNHVGDSETAAGLENAESLAQHPVFVGGKIYHAIGNDDIDGVVGQGNAFDLALEKFDVLNAGLALVLPGEGQHFIGHVEAVSLAGGTDALGGKQHVDAASRAEIEHGFTGIELGQCGRVAASQ